MRDGRCPYSRILLTFLGVAALTFVGCADTEKRSAAATLRESTDYASRLYAQAHALLSNPTYCLEKEGTRETHQAATGVKVLALLSEGETLLEAALRAQYDGILAKQESPDNEAASTAKKTLAMIRHLRGQYYRWDSEAKMPAVEKAMQACLTGLQTVEREAGEAKVLLTLQSMLAGGIVSTVKTLKAQQADAVKAVGAAEARATTLRATIKTQEDKIVAVTKIVSTLKSKSTLASGEKSQALLAKALEEQKAVGVAQNAIHAATRSLDEAEFEASQGRILAKGASDAMKRLEAIRTSRAGEIATLTQKITVQREAIQNNAKALQTSLTEASAFLLKVLQSAEQGESAYLAAAAPLEVAVRLSKGSARAEARMDEGDVQASRGMLQMDLWHLRSQVVAVTERVEAGWEALPKGSPAKPDLSGLTKFTEKTAKSLEQAETSLLRSLDCQSDAVGDVKDEKWTYQRPLAVGYLNYANVLRLAEKTAEADEAVMKAQSLVEEIQEGARDAGRATSIQPLVLRIRAAAARR